RDAAPMGLGPATAPLALLQQAQNVAYSYVGRCVRHAAPLDQSGHGEPERCHVDPGRVALAALVLAVAHDAVSGPAHAPADRRDPAGVGRDLDGRPGLAPVVVRRLDPDQLVVAVSAVWSLVADEYVVAPARRTHPPLAATAQVQLADRRRCRAGSGDPQHPGLASVRRGAGPGGGVTDDPAQRTPRLRTAGLPAGVLVHLEPGLA